MPKPSQAGRRTSMADGRAGKETIGFGQIFLPWVAAAGAGAGVPALLLGVYALSPALRRELRNALVGPWPLCDDSVRGTPLAWIAASSCVYWGFGVLSTVRASRRRQPMLYIVAAILLSAAMALGLYGVPLLSTVWAMATAGGQVVDLGKWVGWAGNHGPWRHLCQLSALLALAILLPGLAFWVGLLAFVARPSWVAAAGTIACALAFLALFATHYWLID